MGDYGYIGIELIEHETIHVTSRDDLRSSSLAVSSALDNTVNPNTSRPSRQVGTPLLFRRL